MLGLLGQQGRAGGSGSSAGGAGRSRVSLLFEGDLAEEVGQGLAVDLGVELGRDAGQEDADLRFGLGPRGSADCRRGRGRGARSRSSCAAPCR
ncbi:MAG: hypothetical protein M0C28_24205 [Candidatus Moduliflexus flocculans]|nr:hypothetical protein [Candidatus Moduliflexus flocculans]